MSIVKSITSAFGTKTLGQAIKAGGYRMILDGNLEQTVLEQTPGSRFVGEDYNGNKYYERLDTESNRDRWVIFKGSSKLDQEPTLIPAEWHAWLHHISDENPSNSDFFRQHPKYEVKATMIATDTPLRHQPKGSWFKPQKRNWLKYQVWDHTAAGAKA